MESLVEKMSPSDLNIICFACGFSKFPVESWSIITEKSTYRYSLTSGMFFICPVVIILIGRFITALIVFIFLRNNHDD